jgi:DUF4097 and DUF4098 domain-containing protein YvlB
MKKLLAQFVLGVLFTTAVAVGQTSVDETRAAKPDGMVEVSNISGAVEVIGWGKDEVHVTGTLERNVERLDFDVRDGRTSIKVVLPDKVHKDASAYLTIHVPAASRLEIETVSAEVGVGGDSTGTLAETTSSDQGKAETEPGDVGLTAPGTKNASRRVGIKTVSGEVQLTAGAETISIQTVSGDVHVKVNANVVEIQTISGDTSLSGTANRVESTSVSGDLELSGVIASLSATTVSGEVTAEGVATGAKMSTSSGDIRLAAREIENGEIETVSGEIDFKGALAPNGRFDASTRSGDITLRFTQEVSAAFEVDTMSGDVETELGGTVPSVTKTGPGKPLRFSAGAGAGLVRIETVSGDVLLRREN